jgi:hypothetical protein
MHKHPPQQGVAVLRDDATGTCTADPGEVGELAAAYTETLLGQPPTIQQPTGKPWQADSLWAPLTASWTPEAAEAATALATAADVASLIMQAGANSAPGLDGVQYNALKLLLRVDSPDPAPSSSGAGPGVLLTLLTNLTNTILRSDTLPDELGKSEMLYFRKKGDPTCLKNYRGIALQSVAYKLAAAFTAKQVLGACDQLGLLVREQVAARKGGRAGDHVAAMTTIIADATRAGKELHIVTCDIQKAFDEVPREALSEALRRHGFPDETVRRAQMLQSCTGTTVRTQYGRSSRAVRTRKGCKQGCPLSPVTYCLFMNMLVMNMKADVACKPYTPAPQAGVSGASGRHAGVLCQAYMDDLATFAEDAASAQAQLSLASGFLAAYGMAFNRLKCCHTVVNPAVGSEGRSQVSAGPDHAQGGLSSGSLGERARCSPVECGKVGRLAVARPRVQSIPAAGDRSAHCKGLIPVE